MELGSGSPGAWTTPTTSCCTTTLVETLIGQETLTDDITALTVGHGRVWAATSGSRVVSFTTQLTDRSSYPLNNPATVLAYGAGYVWASVPADNAVFAPEPAHTGSRVVKRRGSHPGRPRGGARQRLRRQLQRPDPRAAVVEDGRARRKADPRSTQPVCGRGRRRATSGSRAPRATRSPGSTTEPGPRRGRRRPGARAEPAVRVSGSGARRARCRTARTSRDSAPLTVSRATTSSVAISRLDAGGPVVGHRAAECDQDAALGRRDVDDPPQAAGSQRR